MGTHLALTAAAIIGDQTGYWLGRKYGHIMENRADSWWFKRRHLEAARSYFAEKGPPAIVLARYVPLMRTFVPFAAGMGQMPTARFLRWNTWGNPLGELARLARSLLRHHVTRRSTPQGHPYRSRRLLRARRVDRRQATPYFRAGIQNLNVVPAGPEDSTTISPR